VLNPRAKRIAENEIRFREINERMARDVRDIVDPQERLDLVCECGFDTCRETVGMRLGDYDHERADGRHFFLVPGHEIEDLERIVERREGYAVVEKKGDAATVATEHDPRLG